MEKINKMISDFKALNNEEKVKFMKEAMPSMAEGFGSEPQKMMSQIMPICMNIMKSKGFEMNKMQTMMQGMMKGMMG
jgi:hypothetical protein